MSRALRPHLPGAAFHIMAHTIGHDPMLEDLRDPINKIIVDGITSSDAYLISHTVMTNHFHIVLQQGQRRLGWVLHPVMRRTALLVKKKFGIKGHVFRQRFLAKHCDTADYFRTAIVYTHLNAWRARLCATPWDYPWSSHVRYIQADNIGCVDVEFVQVMKVFGDRGDETLDELRARYRDHVDWQCEKDLCEADALPFEKPAPRSDAGDLYFHRAFGVVKNAPAPARKDLRDRAKEILSDVAHQYDIEELRARFLKRDVRGVRKQLVAALSQERYAGKAIADYFRMSSSAVSAIATSIRYADLQRS